MSIQPLRRDLRLPGAPRTRSGLIPSPVRPASCVVVDDLGEATGPAEALHGRDLNALVVLARRADASDLCGMLSDGLRGVVVATPQPQPSPGRPPATVPATTELSAREVGVLRHVADGCSNREVGDHLGLSALTVKSHLARISRKLGTGDRAQLVAIALRSGLLD